MSNLNEILSKLENEELRTEIEKTVNTQYIGRNIAHEDDEVKRKFYGKTFGSFETKLKRNIKGIDESLIAPNEIDELGFEKAFDEAFTRLQGKYQDLSKKAANSGSNDKELKAKLEETTSQLEQFKTKISDLSQFKELVPKLKNEIEQKDQQFTKFKTDLVLNQKRDEAFKAIELTDQIQGQTREFAIKGFKDSFNNKYHIEPSNDSADGLRIIERNTNKRVTDGADFMPLQKLYELEAKQAGLLKVSNGQGDKPKSIIFDKSKRDSDIGDHGFRVKSVKRS